MIQKRGEAVGNYGSLPYPACVRFGSGLAIQKRGLGSQVSSPGCDSDCGVSAAIGSGTVRKNLTGQAFTVTATRQLWGRGI